ncbi:MAG: TIGR01244 family sulfur transferase [Pseudomonadota bacterium]
MIHRLDEKLWVSGQVTPDEVAALKDHGVTVLVNNRPDGEEPGQPLAGDIEAAAQAAGIEYRFHPIQRGIGPAHVEAMQEAIRAAGDGTVLAFCRSGMRSAMAAALARRAEGASSEEVQRSLAEAGFDPGPIAHLL